MFTPSTVGIALDNVYLLIWDFWLTLVNLVMPRRKVGAVVPVGSAGYAGKWPEYIAPKEGDSRSCCPGLNTLANHGILPRDGRNIKFTFMAEKVHTSFNFAPTFCRYVPTYAANMLGRSFKKDTIDLGELNLHNGIEHDASFLRQDAHFQPDQGKPDLPLIHDFLSFATGKDSSDNTILTPADMSRFSAKRRADSAARNPEYTLDYFHKMFGSANAATLLCIFGGRVDDLETFLLEERIREGWEPRVLDHTGLSFVKFNRTALAVEKGIQQDLPEFEKEAKEGGKGDSAV